MQNAKENKMGVMPMGKLVLNMSLPIIASMLVQALYNIVDSIFVSMINQQALNAVSLAFPAQNLMIGFGTGTAVGVNALVSRALGAKQHNRANKIANNGLFLSFICYLIFLLFGIFGSGLFFSTQTTDPVIMGYGKEYLTIVCGLSFGIFGQFIFERLLQATGRTIFTMISQGVGAIINIILDPVFIFVFDMGVAGAALATVLGQIVGCIIGIYFNIKKNPEIKLNLRGFRPDGEIIKNICGIGIPSILMVAVGSVMTYLFNIVLLLYTKAGTYAQNIFGIYFKLNSFVFMPIFGLNNGLVPIISYNYGAQKRSRMTKAIKIGVITASGLMLFGMALFLAIPDKLLSVFITNATAAEIEIMLSVGVPALRIICLPFMVAGVCISLSSVFQALGRGIYSTIMSVCRQLVVLLPAAYVLARIGMNVGNDSLVWWSYPIAEVVSLIVCLFLFRKLYRDLISKVGDNPTEIAA